MKIIDSSSIVKFFSMEPGWEKVEEHLKKSATLAFAPLELGSALLKKIRAKQISPSDASLILKGYSTTARFLDQLQYLDNAMKIALENNLAIYDSLFIAAAIKTEAELVTSDGLQADIAEKLGVTVVRV